MKDRHERLESLRFSLQAKPWPRGQRPQRLDIVIGLDFGTRFTKVGYRILGVDQSRIIVPDAGKPSTALFRSVLFIETAKGVLCRARPGRGRIVDEVPYLKLLLKELEQPSVLVSPIMRKMLNADAIKVMSAFYLSGILRTAIRSISRVEARRLEGRQPVFALNVSVPAAHYDDDATDRFHEVASVALHWAQSGIGEKPEEDLPVLIDLYRRDATVTGQYEISVIPEIVAALYEFIMRRDTPEGVHGFLDVGGGTVDGCIFRLMRRQRPEVNVLSTRVAPLGTIVVAKKALAILYGDLEKRIESELVTRNDIQIEVPLPLDKVADELTNFAAQLLVEAQKKAGGALLHDGSAIYDTRERLRELGKTFTIHVGGGGAGSGWYRGVVAATHEGRKLRANDIMAYRCDLLRAPPQFDVQAVLPFERFVIAYGLTNDAANLESLKMRLPSQLGPGPELPPWSPPGVRYEDTKDLT